jgi:hypothetical protein
MDAFALKYGNHFITIAQSRQLIGVKPKQDRADGAREAVERALPAKSWRAEGTLGGFQIVAICDVSVDAGQLLDRIRRDASIEVATHVFELPERRSIFVPTGELFVEFKPDTSAELKRKIIGEFGLSVRETRGAQGYILVVTPRSPNPVKVACVLQRKRCVCVAEPDLASNAVIKVLRLANEGRPIEQARPRNACQQRPVQAGIVNLEGRRNLFSPRVPALSRRALSLLWDFDGGGLMSDAEAASSERTCWRETFARAVRRRHADSGSNDRQSEREVVAPVVVPAVVTIPAHAPAPNASAAPTIDIVVGSVTIKVPPGADVPTLLTVLQAVRATS